MSCTKCGAENAPDSAFCTSCGTKLDDDKIISEQTGEQAGGEPIPIYPDSNKFSSEKMHSFLQRITAYIKKNKKTVIILACIVAILLILFITPASLRNKPGLNKELSLSSFTPLSDGYLSRSELISIAGQELYIELSKSSDGDDIDIKKTTFSVQSIESGRTSYTGADIAIVKGSYKVYTKYGIMLDPCPFTVTIKENGEVYSCEIDSDL